jgi:hypothetical protein
MISTLDLRPRASPHEWRTLAAERSQQPQWAECQVAELVLDEHGRDEFLNVSAGLAVLAGVDRHVTALDVCPAGATLLADHRSAANCRYDVDQAVP